MLIHRSQSWPFALSRASKVLVIGLLFSSSLSVGNAGSTGPRTALSISVSTKVASLKISWTKLSAHHVTYIVSSNPIGKSCQVVDSTNCDIAVTDSLPWTFRVTAYVPGAASISSTWSAPVLRRYLVIVAGQSNAIGATSYVVDPTSHVNYFSAAYQNSADVHDLINWQPFDLKSSSTGVPVALDTPQMFYGHEIFGPELSLARTLAHERGVSVTIVKAAQTDTSLSFNWNPAKTAGSFVALVDQVRLVMQHDAAKGQLDVLASVLWYQGESDANVGAANYQSELVNFVGALRSRLPMSSAAPLVLVKESIAKLISYRQAHGFCKKDGCIAQVRGDAAVRAADDYVANHLSRVVEIDSITAQRTVSSNFVHLSNVGELAIGVEAAHKIELLLP